MATYKARSSRPSTQAHPLVGKLLKWDSEDHEFYTVSRFIADLGGGCMLARRLSPRTGRDLENSHVVLLALIAQPDMAEIYDDWDTLQKAMADPDEDTKVVKLVPKPE